MRVFKANETVVARLSERRNMFKVKYMITFSGTTFTVVKETLEDARAFAEALPGMYEVIEITKAE